MIEKKESIETIEFPDFAGHAGKALRKDQTKRATEEQMINALKTVEDPDLGIDIYNLGLIYKIMPQKNGNVKIDMTLTSPTCPYAEQLFQGSADAVAELEGVGEVSIKAVWTPAWSMDRLTQEARYDLDLL